MAEGCVLLLVVLDHGEDDCGGASGGLYLRVCYQGEGGDRLATIAVWKNNLLCKGLYLVW